MTAQHPGRRPGRPKGTVVQLRPATASSSARTSDSARVTRPFAPGQTSGRANSLIGRNFRAGCAVCQSPYIIQITEGLVLHRPLRMILEALPPTVSDPEHPHYLTYDMLRHHKRMDHSSLRDLHLDMIYTERAQALGRTMEDAESLALDHVILGRVMMDRYFTHLIENPHWVPETAQVVAVMKMFADAEKEGRQSIDTAVYNQVLGVMIEVVRSVVPDHFEEIMHRVGNNPVVAGILREQQARQELTP